MSAFFEAIPFVFEALALDFLLYVTGVSVLRVISFGTIKYRLMSYVDFKSQRHEPNRYSPAPIFVGLLFYVLMICLIAWVN